MRRLHLLVSVLAASSWLACSSPERDFNDGVGGGAGGTSGTAGSGGTAGGGGTAGSGGAGGSAAGSGGTAGSAGDGATVLAIGTSSLPDAGFNVPYEAAVTASGGDGDYAFSLTAGELPDGLTLGESGTLSGRPLESGTFTVTVTVTDGAGATASVDLTLRVLRKRWLAYLSNEQTFARRELFVVDVSRALLPKTVASTGITTGAGALAFAFSASGTRLAFRAQLVTGEPSRLFVVDTSGDALQPTVPVTTAGQIEGFALTPDGNGIAYHYRDVDEPGVPWELRYQNLADLEAEPLVIGASNGFTSQLAWVTGELLVFQDGAGSLAFTRLENGAFSVPQQLAQMGQVGLVHSPTQRMELYQLFPTGCGRSAYLIDFLSGAAHAAPTDGAYSKVPTYNRQLTRVAIWDGAGAHGVFDAADTDGQSLGSIGPGSFAGCFDVHWSSAGDALVTVDGATPPALVYSTVGSGVTSVAVPGTYDEFRYGQLAWTSPDYFVFASQTRLFGVSVQGGAPSAAQPLAPALGSGDYIQILRAAPDGSAVYYYAAQQTAGVPEPFTLRVGDAAAQPHRLLALGARFIFASDVRWSSDSSRISFTVNDGTGATYSTQLYVADALDPGATAVSLHDAFCDGAGCRRTTAFEFQP